MTCRTCGQSVPPGGGNTGGGGSNSGGGVITAQAVAASNVIAGEPIPSLPSVDNTWTLPQYQNEMQNWIKKLNDYLRRLSGKTVAAAQSIGGQNSQTINVLTNAYYDTRLHRFMGVLTPIQAIAVDAPQTQVLFAPINIEQVLIDAAIEDGDLHRHYVQNVRVWEVGQETDDIEGDSGGGGGGGGGGGDEPQPCPTDCTACTETFDVSGEFASDNDTQSPWTIDPGQSITRVGTTCEWRAPGIGIITATGSDGSTQIIQPFVLLCQMSRWKITYSDWQFSADNLTGCPPDTLNTTSFQGAGNLSGAIILTPH